MTQISRYSSCASGNEGKVELTDNSKIQDITPLLHQSANREEVFE